MLYGPRGLMSRTVRAAACWTPCIGAIDAWFAGVDSALARSPACGKPAGKPVKTALQ